MAEAGREIVSVLPDSDGNVEREGITLMRRKWARLFNSPERARIDGLPTPSPQQQCSGS